MDCPPSADDVFGPRVSSCRRQFDFTLLFEDSILGILPSCLFLCLACLRGWILVKDTTKTRPGILYFCKQVIILIYFSLHIGLLAELCRSNFFRSRSTIPAQATYILVTVVLFVLSHLEHRKTVRPSPLLNTYLVITLLADIARSRTAWLYTAPRSICILLTAAITVKALLIGLENVSKSRLLALEGSESTREESSGIFGLTFYTWLLPLMRKGYHKVLAVEDLENLQLSMSSEFLWMQCDGKRDTQDIRHKQSDRRQSLVWATLRTMKIDTFLPVIPRLFLTAFTFAQPLLLKKVIAYVESADNNDISVGYGLLAAYALVYLGVAISTSWYWRYTYIWVIKVRGCLGTMIYDKTLQGESMKKDERLAMTLMSNDVQRIVKGLRNFYEIGGCALDAAIAIWLLEIEIGLATIAMLAVSLACTFLIVLLSRQIGERQRLWIQATQKRVSATADMLASMKAVKMMGVEARLSRQLKLLRGREILISKAYRYFTSASIVLSYMPYILSPVLVFVAYIATTRKEHRLLDASRMFTSLTLITLLATPLITLFQTLPMFRASLVCFRRIQDFLETDSWHDYRVRPIVYESESADIEGSQKAVELAATLKGQRSLGEPVVVFEDASLGWMHDKPAVVQQLNLRVARGDLVMIVGPVGSGKSLVLKAMLGEIPVLAGSVSLCTSRIAFCDQTPWLQNLTIRQNVLGPSAFEELWYTRVLHACALDQDIQMLEGGDSYHVGSGGSKLSGGQKQRLTLARAIYARKEILILDDVFSGIDMKTEELVTSQLWGPDGIFKSLSTAVILTTHRARQLRYADGILVMGSDGLPTEQGTFDELLASKGYVHSLYSGSEEIQGALPAVKDSPGFREPEVDQSAPTVFEKTKLVQDKASENVSGTSGAIYGYYFRSISALDSIIFFCGAVFFAVALKFPDLWLKWWSDQGHGTIGHRVGYWLGLYSFFQGLAIFSLAASIWHLMSRLTTTSGKNLHQQLLHVVLAMPFSLISSIDTGVTINRFSQDMQYVDSTLPYALWNTVTEFFTCVMQLALVAVASVYLIAAYPLIFGILYALQKFYLRTSKQLRVLEIEAKSPLQTQFLETISGLSAIRAFGWEVQLREQNQSLMDTSQRPMYTLYCVQVWLNMVLELIVAGLAVLTIGLIIGLKGKVSSGSVGVALLNITTLGSTLKSFVLSWTSFEISLGAIDRLETFSRETSYENLPGEINEPQKGWPTKGAIEFRGVEAYYRKDGPRVLKEISLAVEAGQKVAVLGRTGSGKTSLVLALFRMIELSKGHINIDGIDISKIPRDIVRSHLNVVTQDPYWVPGTFRVNLDPDNVVSDERVPNLLRTLSLWSKIEKEGGLDAEANFDTFSHGQKQLLCLARAVLKPGRILILDEAMSSVDAGTRKVMERVIMEELPRHTIISIIHRPETEIKYDKIVLLDRGRVVAFDAPERLKDLVRGFEEEQEKA